jgi:hypothetical protein
MPLGLSNENPRSEGVQLERYPGSTSYPLLENAEPWTAALALKAAFTISITATEETAQGCSRILYRRAEGRWRASAQLHRFSAPFSISQK